jgi:Phosphoesterase family
MRWIAFLLCIAAATPPLHAARHRAAVPPANGIGEVQRVIVVVLENEDLDDALLQPELVSLAARGALLRNYFAITHNSQPNYIALTAGGTYAVQNDPVTLDVPHLGHLLEGRGVSWKTYAEGYPGGCFLGAATGLYVRRHVPFLSFADVQNDPARCARVVPASQFDADVQNGALPRFALYIPDLNDDGHNTSVAFAAEWLRARFEPLLSDPSFMNGLLFIVVFDEGRIPGPNRVYCALLGAGVRPGSVSFATYDHYGLLRTIEQIFHTESLHRLDESAKGILDIWR